MKFPTGLHSLVCLAAASAAFCADAAAQEQAVAPAPQQAAVVGAAALAPARSTARIRLFGQNGFGVLFYEGSACFGGRAKETAVVGFADAFWSFVGTVKNVSIGIRDTPNTLNIEKRSGMASKAYFREYEVAPRQPLTVWMDFRSDLGYAYTYCKAIASTFTPEAGKDYEASLELADGRCLALINEIADAADGSVQLHAVDVAPAKKCE